MQKDSGKPSRLWNIEDFEDVVNNTGIMAMEAIWCTYVHKLYFSEEAMINMKRLRILCICDENDLCRIAFSSSSPLRLTPIAMMTPLSTCPTTCVGLSGMTILGSYFQKILILEGLFILISGGVRCIIYGMKQSNCRLYGG
uniref:Putative ovule protein n=1 Tax=Solanum chacoense TaxID=4108 RepID=A0A0V0GQH5_SOLCH